jgi:hypothetical protein
MHVDAAELGRIEPDLEAIPAVACLRNDFDGQSGQRYGRRIGSGDVRARRRCGPGAVSGIPATGSEELCCSILRPLLAAATCLAGPSAAAATVGAASAGAAG